jgi:hypothetical protein
MPKIQRVGLAIALLFTLTGSARAGDDAQAWIEKMAERTDQGYYKVRINADMNVTNQGVRSVLKMNGSANFATPEMFRVTLDMSMEMGGSAMAVTMLSVADGKIFWVEMDSPMMGGKQIVKGAVGDLERVAQMTGGVGMGGVGSNPVNEIKGIVERFDMRVLEKTDGRVVLYADVTPEQSAGLADLGPFAASMKYVRLEIDEKDAMPVKLILGGAEPIITMDFVEYEFFGPEAVQPSEYSYVPPAGYPINDLTGVVAE